MAVFLIWLLICFFLALLNFAESSITSLSAARIKGLKAVLGKPFGEAAARWLHHPEEYLTLLLLVQNILESYYAWFLVLCLAVWIQDPIQRQTLAWALGSMIGLIFLTLYPKLLGRRLSHGVMGAWILRILYAALTPLYPLLRSFFQVVSKISSSRDQGGALGRGLAMSLEEMRELLDFGPAQFQTGNPPALQMMANYLKLKEMRVQEIMTPKEAVSWVEAKIIHPSAPATPERERMIFRLMTDGHTRTLVVEGALPVGYVHAKDVLRAVVEAEGDSRRIQWRDALRPIPVVHARQTVLGALPLLLRHSPIAFVVQGSQWVGIVTAEDVLEEITGEILDEFEHRKRRGGVRNRVA